MPLLALFALPAALAAPFAAVPRPSAALLETPLQSAGLATASTNGDVGTPRGAYVEPARVILSSDQEARVQVERVY